MRCSKWESSGHQPVESRLSTHILLALPCEFGAAIAVVQHRGPKKWSMLAQVIGRSCRFPILDAEG